MGFISYAASKIPQDKALIYFFLLFHQRNLLFRLYTSCQYFLTYHNFSSICSALNVVGSNKRKVIERSIENKYWFVTIIHTTAMPITVTHKKDKHRENMRLACSIYSESNKSFIVIATFHTIDLFLVKI